MLKLKKVLKANEMKNPRGYSLRYAKMPDNVDSLYRASMGITEDDLKAIAGKWVFLAREYDENERGRYVIRGAFVGGDASFAVGSFNGDALSRLAYICTTEAETLCPECGRLDIPANHKCTNATCCRCNREIINKSADGLCDECATGFAQHSFEYHCHPQRRYFSPQFERPHIRNKYCHLGLENEIDSRTPQEQTLARELGKIINPDIHKRNAKFEHDGSIPNGVECILEPFTLKGLNNMRDTFNAFYSKANEINGRKWSEGARPTAGNGLHIHIDRAFFEGEDEVASLALSSMVYKYYEFFKTISGRRQDNFGYALGYDGEVNFVNMCKKVFNPDNHHHEDAVNCSNKNTIEVRIFGGFIDTGDKMLAVADIVNALARWAKETPLQNQSKAHPVDIVRYINDPANVLAFVENRNERAYKSVEGDVLLAQFVEKLKSKM
jgi:hypothetical protein